MVSIDDHLLRWAEQADFEPHAVLQAVRDHDGVVRDFVYREINDLACRQHRRPPEDLLNRSVADTLPEVKRIGLLTAYAQCVNSGRPVILGDVVYHGTAIPGTAPDSATPQTRHYEVRIAPLPDDCISLRWRDITNRIEAERRLADTAERYRLLAENSVDVVAHVGADGLVKWVSPSVEWTFGAPPSHWVGLPGIDVVAPSDAEPAEEMEHRLLTGGREFRRVRTLDAQGGVHWSEVHAQPFYDSDGRQDGYISFIRLIDDKVALEQQRDAASADQQQADARYRRLTEKSPVATAISSLDGRFTLANPAMCALLGYSADELLTMTWRDITHPDDLEKASAAVADLIAGRVDSIQTTACYRHADGHRVWGEVSVVLLPDAAGEKAELAAQIVDITAQIEAQDRLQAVTDAMLDPQVLIEAVRDSGGQVVDFVYRQVNDAACDYRGISREEMVGSRQLDTLTNLRDSGLHERYVRCLQTGEPVVLDDFAFFNEMLDGTRRYDIRAARATADTLSVTWRDVTDRFVEAQKLSRSHELLRAATDSMLDPYLLAETITNASGEVVDLLIRDVNSALCDFIGLSEDELVNRNVLAIWPNLVDSELMAGYAACATTGEPLVLNDVEYFVELLNETHRYDIRGARIRPGLITLSYRDVKERHELTQRVADSEQYYRLLSENIGDVVAHTGPDGIVRWVSASVEKTFGAPAQAWVGRSIQALVVPEDLPIAAEAIIAADSGAIVHRRIRVFDSSGAIHWVDFSGNRFIDAQGQPDGYVSSFRIVDAEVAAEAELADAYAAQARADALYRRSMESTAVGTCLASPDGRFFEVNEAMCNFFGYDAQTLVAMNWIDLNAPDGLDLSPLDEMLAGRIDSYLIKEQKFLHATGRPIWGDIYVACLRDVNGNVDTLVGQVVDVTNEVRSRERLAESEEHYRMLTLNSTDAILHVREGVLVWASPAIEEVLGAPPEHWVGTPVLAMTPPEDIPAAEDALAKLDFGGEINERRPILSVDGVVHWVHVHARPFHDARGHRDGMIAALRLVDHEVAAEAELAEARAREAAANALYRRSMEDSAVGWSLAGVDGDLLEVNDALCEFFGYDAETMLQNKWQNWSSPEYLPLELGYIEEMMSGERDSYRMVKDYVHADGHRIWGDLSVACIRGTDGRVERFIGHIIDITAEVHAREQLAASEERYRLMTQNASDAITHIRDGKFVWVSDAIQNVLGAPPEHWIGGDVSEIIPPEDTAAYRERLAILDAGGSLQKRIRLTAVDGVTHWVDVHSTPFFDADGRRDGFTGMLRVVDDQVAAEQELAEARARQAAADALHRRSMESAAVGMCLASPEGPLIEVNQAFCDFFGYDTETMLTKTWIELNAPEYREADLANVVELVAGRLESYEMDKQFLHADGHRIWGHLAVGCMRKPDGSVAMTIGQIVDITAEVHARQRLAASEEHYRMIAENIADVVIRVRGGRIVWITPSVESLLGAPASYWVGRYALELFTTEERAAAEDRLAVLEAGQSYQRRSQVMSVDGTTHWVHVDARPFYDSNGNQDGVIGLLRPIDDEVRAENEAVAARRREARAEALYRRSVDSAAVGMCLIDPTGAFIEVNEAVCEFFGYDADTLKQKTWQELTAPDSLEADLSKVEDVLEGRRDTYRMLKQYVHADGRLIWGDLSVSCVRDDHGRVEQFISQITDVTDTVEANARNAELSQRLSNDLRSAANYMESIMPGELTGAVSVTSRYSPSQELGGDCFDYYWIDDDHLVVYLIDVSGHGIEPALLAVSLQNLLRSGAFSRDTLLDPSAVLAQLNQMFQMEHQVDHFFTMFYGVYEKCTRTLRYANGGAPPAYAFSMTDEGRVTATPMFTDAPPVGVMPDLAFATKTLAIPRGCRILVFSDGASELPLGDGGHLTHDDFESLLTDVAGSANWSLDDLLVALRSVTPDGAFEDDVSLIQLAFD